MTESRAGAALPLPRHLLSDHTSDGDDGYVAVGGCSVADLAREYGTPLFVYDEEHLRARCREAVDAFGHERVVYATKAFLCRAMAKLAYEEGLLLDVATGGELHVALAEEGQRAVGERSEVAAGAQRAVLGDERRDARVEQVDHVPIFSPHDRAARDELRFASELLFHEAKNRPTRRDRVGVGVIVHHDQDFFVVGKCFEQAVGMQSRASRRLGHIDLPGQRLP